MTTNPGLPPELRDPTVLASLRKAGEWAAREQTSDFELVEDAAMHGLEALFTAMLRAGAPEPGAWSSYVRTASRRYAQDRDRRDKRNRPAGFGGSMLLPAGGMDGRAIVDEALLRDRGSPSLGSKVAEGVDAERVAVLMEELSSLDQEILRAKYVEGQRTRQIAEATGLSEKAVERRLAKAKKLLREDL